MKRLLVLFILWNGIVWSSLRSDVLSNWTWIYKKKFADYDSATLAQKKSLIFMQDHICPFTQLILSWNIVRPHRGYFSFYVQVRDKTTKKWGIWHHIADWGYNLQQSFLSKSDGFSSHNYVRLETDNKKLADAFRIKIEPQVACLSLVHGISVACSNFNLFKPESQDTVQDLPSVSLLDMPSIAQFSLDHIDKGRICSPVSCSMVVHYLTGNYKDPFNFMEMAFDSGLGVYGSWPFNTAHAFECCEGKVCFFVRRMNFFKDIHQQLTSGLPVIVSVRGTLPGAFKPFPHGHLMVIVGWDSETREVLCHDPACEKEDMVFKRYPLSDFLQAWERSHRLVYVAEPTVFNIAKNC